MSILNYNEIKAKKFIVHEGEPWEVIEAQVSRKQANKPVNKTKLKSRVTGRTVEHTFHVSDKAYEADLTRVELTFLYYQAKKDEYWFASADNPKDRFTLTETVVGPEIQYIKEKSSISALLYTDREGEENIIGLHYPMKVTLEVTEAPPSIKGDTATGGRKVVIVETGAKVNTPLFIEAGEKIVVKIPSGEYSERAK